MESLEERLEKALGEEFFNENVLFRTGGRRMVIRTGARGMELFEEAMEKHTGFYRVYIGKKVLRILRRCKTPIRKSSLTGRYYKLLKK